MLKRLNLEGNLGRFVFPIIGILPFFVLLSLFGLSPKRDWDYFNSLALVQREAFLSGRIPNLDPWVCGGIDILSNPQNWVFSPAMLLNLALPPFYGNVLSLIVFSLFGFMGMLRLLDSQDKLTKFLFSTLFVLSPFFFLHFAEGHLTFRTFYLLPWVLYFARSFNLKSYFGLTCVLSVMMLDGGIYPLYYSIFLCLFNLDYSGLKSTIQTRGKDFLLISFGGVLVSLAKVVPVLSIHGNRTPERESIVYSLKNLFIAFFDIQQSNYKMMEGQIYFFHEYGHYIGISLVLLFALSYKTFLKNKKLFVQMILFLWIALGWGGVFNPWTLIMQIPFINQMHVQSRFLILFYMMFLLVIAKCDFKLKLQKVLLGTAVLELLVCGVLINYYTRMELRPVSEIALAKERGPFQAYEKYVPKPLVYSQGLLSYACYEPANPRMLKNSQDLFLLSKVPMGLSVSGSDLVIRSEQPMGDGFALNYHWNAGWDCENCEAVANEGLIEIHPKPGVKEIKLSYAPTYFHFVVLSYVLGIILLGNIFFRFRKNDI